MASEPAVIELANGKESGRAEEEHKLLQEKAESSSAVLDEEQGPETVEGKFQLRTRRWLIAAAATTAVLVVLVVLLILNTQAWFMPDTTVHFFVIGDWGRDGLQNQSLVAQAMANRASVKKPDFIISVGDNMYESGLVSVDDQQFDTSFSAVYSQSSLQVPWHVILGNHDYGEFWNETKDLKQCPEADPDCYFSPLHQLSGKLTERDKRWHCERSFHLKALDGSAHLFFIDTNPFIQDYREQLWAANRGGILEQSWEAELLELDASLATSKAAWKLVFGHHPVRNNHLPWNTLELIEHLEPVLEKQGVQAYFSGHEHNLQYIHVENATTHYVVSGAGSKTDYFPEAYWDNGGSIFQHQGSGFVSCQLSRASLDCEFLSIASKEPLLSISIKQNT